MSDEIGFKDLYREPEPPAKVEGEADAVSGADNVGFIDLNPMSWAEAAFQGVVSKAGRDVAPKQAPAPPPPPPPPPPPTPAEKAAAFVSEYKVPIYAGIGIFGVAVIGLFLRR